MFSSTPVHVLLPVAWQLLVTVLCLTDSPKRAMPSIPLNLTLVHNPPLYYKEAEISWSPGNPHEPLTDYIIVNRAEGSDTKAVTRIDPEYTSFTLKDLKEETKYVVYVKAAIGNDHSEGSSKLEFNTQSKRGLHRTFTTTAADILILLMVLAVWFGALSLFIRTWRKKMNGHVSQSSSNAGTPVRLRSRYRKPWMWSQKRRPDHRGYPMT
ncbi:uncharacterized protein [Asterias amurensis]|uniref:uncharacterized protein n=1 Tax=Asterias amurensis TaxID=7602 RepID=UPI003AB53439